MDYCQKNFCHTSTWQATLEGILTNLKDEIQVAISSESSEHQPEPRKFTTEALIMLYVILSFVILSIIGSSVAAIELFCKEIGKEISCLIVKKNPKSANAAGVKRKSFDASTHTGSKLKYMNINNLKQVARCGFRLTFKLMLRNDVWKSCKKYLQCFSVQNNARKLLGSVSGEGNFNCLHGIKTLALVWVMINHIAMFYATIINGRSYASFKKVLEMTITQLVLNGIFANDVFFVLSGFSTAYVFFDYYTKRNGRIPWLLFYLSRFLRFTPLYLIVLGSYATLFSYIGSGPIWPTYHTNPMCKENWIWNVLYVNNFLTHKRQCLLTTWYIACDLQLYIISPLFLLTLMRRPKVGFALILAAVLGSGLTSFVLTKYFGLIDGASKLAGLSHDMRAFYGRFWTYFDMIYVKPYNRIGTYVIGIALGYFVFQRKCNGIKKTQSLTLCVGWILTLIALGIALFGIHNREETDFERALYNGTKHILCSCGISWVIFVCVTEQGGLVNRVLSLPFFVPLSRISYSLYFIHIIAIDKYVLSIEELVDYSLGSMVLVHVKIMMWSVAISFLVSLIFERPLLNIIGLLMKEAKQEKKVQ